MNALRSIPPPDGRFLALPFLGGEVGFTPSGTGRSLVERPVEVLPTGGDVRKETPVAYRRMNSSH
jgi:hypothetical protein